MALCRACSKATASECSECGTPYCSMECLSGDPFHEVACEMATSEGLVGMGFNEADVSRMRLEKGFITNIYEKTEDWPVLDTVDYFSRAVGFSTPLFTFISEAIATHLKLYSVHIKSLDHTKFSRRGSGGAPMVSVEVVEGIKVLVMVRTTKDYSPITFVSDHRDAIAQLMKDVNGEPFYLKCLEDLYSRTSTAKSRTYMQMTDASSQPMAYNIRKSWFETTSRKLLEAKLKKKPEIKPEERDRLTFAARFTF
jgi:hypothetical protein